MQSSGKDWFHFTISTRDHKMTDKTTYKGLEVIGAGFGRTGTVTLKKALEILGYSPCYHMIDLYVNRHNLFWLRLFKGERLNFDDIYKKGNYKASCDNPMSTYWKEQLEQYPEAKVILTVRDPEKWYKSWNETINTIMSGSPQSSYLLNVTEWVLGIRAFHMGLKQRLFGESWEKEHFMQCYSEHNTRVVAECPKDKLLVYEVSQGWEPLCAFLGKPVPNVPFPHLNDTKEIQKSRLLLEVVGGVIVAAAVSLPILGLMCIWGKGRCNWQQCAAAWKVK